MSILLSERDLPQELTTAEAVEAAYASSLAEVEDKLKHRLPVLIECDKDLAPWLYQNIKKRLKPAKIDCVPIHGVAANPSDPMAGSMMSVMIGQIRDAVRGVVDTRRVICLLHLDLLTTSAGGLTSEAREVIPLLYENPEVVWLGFKDPSFPVPEVIENLFPHRISLLGIPRSRLRHLVTQAESRKFGKQFNPWALYKYVSGVNAVRLRKLLDTLQGEDYPANARHVYRQLRQATLGGTLEVPDIELDQDIGGYAKVKERLRKEILDVLAYKEQTTDAAEITWMEELIPKGMIFWGPPGTGKTLFAKAMAASIGAAITIVSGPELKSMWVGKSEENLRQIFHAARQSAPSIIVFDELDSFASARGTYTGSGVEHSMVNQLLTEMDGFHKDELVFVVGTTNFVEILDPALLRPGRFEFHLYIPYPEADDRREILKIYNHKMKLHMTPEALEFAVKRTGEFVPGVAAGTRYSGDHINALCRAIARMRVRHHRERDTTAEDVERALKPTTAAEVEHAITEWIEQPNMTAAEQRVLATHEAGHAIVALFCPKAPPIERITIRSDMQWAFGYVRYADPAHRYIQTRGFYLDLICVALGAREAERLLLDDISLGAVADLQAATAMAREMVEEHGMGGDAVGIARFRPDRPEHPRNAHLSPAQLEAIDRRVNEILEEQRQRAAQILRENQGALESLRDLLLEKKVIDAKTLTEMMAEKKG
jgi:cell division protease FtsH